MWTLLRAGRIDAAQRLCESHGEAWRAASLAGGQEDLEYPKIDDCFDYLLNMSIRTLTKKRSDELNNSHDNKETELNILKGKTEKDLWIEDLTELEDCYQKMMIHFEETYFGDNSSKPTKSSKKKVIKKVIKKKINKK